MATEPKTYREKCEYIQRIRHGRNGKLGQLSADEENKILEREVNKLIQSLYIPDPETGWRARPDVKQFAHEAINWGDLSASVTRDPQSGWAFVIGIEEASPECLDFPQWIEDWCHRWGWKNVKVECEW